MIRQARTFIIMFRKMEYLYLKTYFVLTLFGISVASELQEKCSSIGASMWCTNLRGNFIPSDSLEVNLLYIIDCDMRDIVSEDISVFRNLEFVKIVNSTFFTVREVFSDLPSLNELVIKQCNLTGEDLIALSKNGNLQTLNFEENNITSIPKNAFKPLSSIKMSLEELNLRSNQIVGIDQGSFRGIESLKTLLLSNNKLSGVFGSTFTDLENVEMIDLSFNRITEIEYGSFEGTNSLKTLNLTGNFIGKFFHRDYVATRHTCYVCGTNTGNVSCSPTDTTLCGKSRSLDDLWLRFYPDRVLKLNNNPVCDVIMNESVYAYVTAPDEQEIFSEECKVLDAGSCFVQETRRRYIADACGIVAPSDSAGDDEERKNTSSTQNENTRNVSKRDTSITNTFNDKDINYVLITSIAFTFILSFLLGSFCEYKWSIPFKWMNSQRPTSPRHHGFRRRFSPDTSDSELEEDKLLRGFENRAVVIEMENLGVQSTSGDSKPQQCVSETENSTSQHEESIPSSSNTIDSGSSSNLEDRLSSSHPASSVEGISLALYIAAREGSVREVESRLASGGRLDYRDEEGNTPLHAAAQGGHWKTVRILLDLAADCNAPNSAGNTPLHVAVRAGFLDIAKHLLKLRAHVDAPNKEGDTALHLAAASGNRPILNALLRAKANVTRANLRHETPLHYAVRQGYLGSAKLLLRAGANPNGRDVDGNTTVHLAATEGHAAILNQLLQNGGVAGLMNKYGDTPLHIAAWNGHGSIVELLLENSATVDERNLKGQTPLMNAALKGHLTVVKALLGHNAGTALTNAKGNSALQYAAKGGHNEVAEALLDAGARVKVENLSGNSPLHEAAAAGHVEVARTLIGRGADVSAKNHEGATPRDLAEGKNGVIVNLLSPSTFA